MILSAKKVGADKLKTSLMIQAVDYSVAALIPHTAHTNRTGLATELRKLS